MAQGQETRPVTPTEEAQGALGASSATQQGNSSSSISFRAAGETNPNKVAELPDFKDNNLSGEGSDAYRSDHDNTVALSRQEAEKTSRKKPIRPRDDKKWSVGADLHLMSIVAKHEVWCVADGKKILEDKWEAAHGEFQQEPAVRIYAAKKRSTIESPFDQLVRNQGAKNSDASRAFGCGNTSADDMTEDETRQEKSTMAVADAKADIKANKTEERLKNADKNILGAAAVGMDSRQCGPGAIAISSGDARVSDERALVGVLCRRNSGAGATASSRMSGSASGGSSPATTGGTPAGVPALGFKLRFEMGVLDTNELGKLAGATREELDLFVNTGFLVEQINRERAVKMMEEVIKSRFKKVWGGKALLKFVGDESESTISGGSDVVVGLGAQCFSELCVHYGVEDDAFYAMGLKANWFVNGWRVGDAPTADEFDRLTKALASMLLDGHYSTGPLSNGGGRGSGTGNSSVLGSGNGSSSVLGSGNNERAGGAGAPSGSGPSRQSKSDGKSRKNTKRSDEVNLEGMLEQSTRKSKERAYQGELREDAGEARTEKRKWEEMQEHRKLRKMELDAERELRADERTTAAATEDAIRKEERIAADAIRREERITADAIRREERIAADAIRREERISADAIRTEERIAADAIRTEDKIRQERKDEEDKRRQERKDERTHELAMLRMQLELSKT